MSVIFASQDVFYSVELCGRKYPIIEQRVSVNSEVIECSLNSACEVRSCNEEVINLKVQQMREISL